MFDSSEINRWSSLYKKCWKKKSALTWLMLQWVAKYKLTFIFYVISLIFEYKISIKLFKISFILKYTWKQNFIYFLEFFYLF
jgi:hypothetical protein